MFLHKIHILYITAILFGLFTHTVLHAADNSDNQNRYKPYFELGGAKYFNQNSNAAGIYDLFIPLYQQKGDQIFFTDLRIFDRSGSSFEGNVHLGYRKIFLDTKQMFGIYGSFDRKRSDNQNLFNQLTLGAEYWHDKWFVGGNIYKPVGTTKKLIGEIETQETIITSRNITEIKITNKLYEKALYGFDAELGYAITDNLTAYAGGYYFTAANADVIAGPKINLTYEYKRSTGRILGVLDGISIEAGAGHDKPRGNTAYIGIKFKIGLTNLDKNSNVSGFERHMVELVRRDPDIVVKNILEQQVKKSRYEIFDESSLDEERLAWLVERNLNVNDIFTDGTDQEYIPFLTNQPLIKHFGIRLANKAGDIVYYGGDSFVHGFPEDRNNPKRKGDSHLPYVRSQLGVNEVGFNNEVIYQSLKTTALRWDRNSSKWDGIEYDILRHNCQIFVSDAMDEYSKHKKIYLKRVPYGSYFKMDD
ncbi:MAG TPA: inverse autotransporter beta domain-containing protein [Candidatus Babeliales bacterium]|nr:inverse autotransporter beta domain-containing protein [Candidatus Babeliales bacterium]